MPISIAESTSPRKSIDLTVVPSATGIAVSGRVEVYDADGGRRYEVDTFVPCVYTDAADYQLALHPNPPRVELRAVELVPGVDERGSAVLRGGRRHYTDAPGTKRDPSGGYDFATWRLTEPTDTCETVEISVTKRVLVPDPPTVLQHPVMETYVHTDAEGVESTRTRQVIINGEPQYTLEIIPAPPLPDPTVYAVDPVPVLPPAVPLDELKARAFAAIDKKTTALFATGYEWPQGSGIRLSLSLEAQSRLNGLLILKDTPAVTYPIRWNAIDDTQYVDIADAAAVLSMYGTAAATLRAYVDSGTVVKDAVRAATTPAEVQAAVTADAR